MYKVKLGRYSRCGFLATGHTKIEWDIPEQGSSTIWNYALNFTGSPCQPYGGETIEEAARNITNGLWLLRNSANC